VKLVKTTRGDPPDYAALLSRQSLAMQMIEAAPLAWLLVDAAGTIVFANDPTETVLGWSPSELVGRPIEVLVPADVRARHAERRERYLSALKKEPIRSMDLRAVHRDGRILAVDLKLSPLDLEGETLVLAIVQDVTVQRERERHLRALKRELERSNAELTRHARELERANSELERLDAEKNHLLGMAAHDLRNPLGVVLGFASHALDSLDSMERDDLEDVLRRIRGSSEFMRTLVDDLLDLAAIESGTLVLRQRAVEPRAFLAEKRDSNELFAEQKGIHLVAEVEEGLPAVWIDPIRFEQAIDNLVGNAIKYSEPGTTVTMRAVRGTEECEVVFSVHDEGRGMSPEFLARLFEPFAKERATGTRGEKSTGLGLAIVRRVAEAHGGRVWVESQLGRGSTFYVCAPVLGADTRKRTALARGAP